MTMLFLPIPLGRPFDEVVIGESRPRRAKGSAPLAILCFDDEGLELSIHKMVLESAGYVVFTARMKPRGWNCSGPTTSTW
jgi:hypothetical protein